MVDFPGLVGAIKDIAFFPGWGTPEETGYMTFAAPLAIAGGVPEAFVLEGGCFKQHRDVNVCFELVLSKTVRRKRVVLERVEWLSLRGGHSNKKARPQGIPRRTNATHLHPFDLNYITTQRCMRNGNLPVADNIPQRLDNFDDLLIFVGNRFHIRNINLVERPNWEYGLFDG